LRVLAKDYKDTTDAGRQPDKKMHEKQGGSSL